MYRLLSKPYPQFESYQDMLKFSTSVSIFLFLLFFLFEPFESQKLDSTMQFKMALSYATLSWVVIAIYSKILFSFFPIFMNEEKWTTGKEFVFLIIIMVLLASAMFLANGYFLHREFSVVAYLITLKRVITVSIIPILTSIAIKYIYVIQRNLKNATQINDKILSTTTKVGKVDVSAIPIYSENKSEKFRLDPQTFLFAKSEGNYVDIYYELECDIVKKTIRTSLKNLASNLRPFSFVTRCHRAYIVNMNKIQKVEGNSRGYILQFGSQLPHIPVSRKFIPIIKSRLV